MLKKLFLAMMAFAAISFGFVSCSDDDDDENPYEKYYGTYTGTMSVTYSGQTTNSALSITVAEKSVNLGGNYGSYDSVLWFKNSDSKATVAGKSSKAAEDATLTTENYTDKTVSGFYIVFNDDGTATLTIPAMAAMGGSATITKQ